MYRAPEAGGYKDTPYIEANWAGFYVGVYGGGAWGDLKVADVNGFAAFAAPGTVTKSSPDSAFGGGTIGYNFQRGHFVYGLEVDLGGIGTAVSRPIVGTGSNTHVGLDDGFYGDVTGRVGYAWDRTLIYGKGGFAFLDAARTFSTLAPYTAGGIDTFTGWTAAAGIEYKISPAWSVKAEYQYFDFGDQTFVLSGGGYRFKEALTSETVKGGINYHFGSIYEPLK
jgi:outer membrane immunogenic protein